MRILLVEDDDLIADVVKQGLERAQYQVSVAPDGDTGLKMAQEGTFALIILDIMLPGMNGWMVCETLRRTRNRLPILMLTALDNLDERVMGLELGADDYLAKPFDFPELLARVRALLRRDKIHKTRIIEVADLQLDTGLRRVSRLGKEISLTRNEYLLLEALVSHEGVTLTREYIQETVWMNDDSGSNTVAVCIGQLRKKIDEGYRIKLIQTVHGIGYTLRRPESAEDAA